MGTTLSASDLALLENLGLSNGAIEPPVKSGTKARAPQEGSVDFLSGSSTESSDGLSGSGGGLSARQLPITTANTDGVIPIQTPNGLVLVSQSQLNKGAASGQKTAPDSTFAPNQLVNGTQMGQANTANTPTADPARVAAFSKEPTPSLEAKKVQLQSVPAPQGGSGDVLMDLVSQESAQYYSAQDDLLAINEVLQQRSTGKGPDQTDGNPKTSPQDGQTTPSSAGGTPTQGAPKSQADLQTAVKEYVSAHPMPGGKGKDARHGRDQWWTDFKNFAKEKGIDLSSFDSEGRDKVGREWSKQGGDAAQAIADWVSAKAPK